MQLFLAVAAVLQIGLCGHVAVRMPYLNPAGVTYIQNDIHSAPGAYAYTSGGAFLPRYAYPGAQFQYAAQQEFPAKIEAQHVGYANAEVPAVAAVPFVKHVPTVSQVPVTRYEAHPALIEKQLDVVKPAVSTRKVEVRRPAIQKQFYDIEERVIIRPAGSAVVELDEPTSKQQRGPTVVQPLEGHAGIAHYPSGSQFFAHSTPSTLFFPSSTPAPEAQPTTPTAPEDEAVVVENANFRDSGVNGQQGQEQQQSGGAQAQNPEPQVITRSNGTPLETPGPRYIAHDPSPSVIPSQRSTPEENQFNQNKLIQLLTAHGGVTEVGLSRDGSIVSQASSGDAGHVRARVLSATPAPDNAEPTNERVSTRRVVVSRPIETLQEIDVVEPASKIERVSYQQPTFIKTAHLDHVQVHGSVPVVGKALAPAVAHATVPVYQKTISPAYQYYKR